ncbi:MAG TPA: hypothetical protein VHT75_04360 [Acidimicrobiales bacterium]|jgi:hypothetical protein|nr:hypothetical protein [Acidimicrobiales bacterium]
MPYSGLNIVSGAGTLYAAPLGTTEPTSVTGAWPAGWTALGYTEQGSQFSIKPTANPITPEEEYWPVRNVITAYDGHLTFALAETTFQNWMVALNSGIGTSQLAGSHGTNADGSSWVEMPTIGTEVRVMLGWDSLTEATTAGQVQGRLVIRQTFQVGQAQVTRRKGANIAAISCDFQLEKPVGVNPFRLLVPAAMAS